MTRIDSPKSSPKAGNSAAASKLKTLGLLGGMSPESTVDYYQRINAGVRQALGAHHSARMFLFSADLQQALSWLVSHDDISLGRYLESAAKGLEAAGAEFVIMACNTAHKVAPQLEEALDVPFVHIADVLGENLRQAGHRRVGLLASRITAEASFYRERLARFGIETLAPSKADRLEVDRIIREELCFHEIRDSSRQLYQEVAGRLKEQGADAIALSCTEIGMLIDTPEVAGLPVFDTTALHAQWAVELALGSRPLVKSSKAA